MPSFVLLDQNTTLYFILTYYFTLTVTPSIQGNSNIQIKIEIDQRCKLWL